MYKVLTVVFLIVFTVQNSNGDSHSLGNCPDVDPLSDFQMQKILGEWYVIQKSSTSTRCIKNTFEEAENEPGHYNFIITEPSSRLWTSALYHEVHTKGSLTTPNASIPARMDLDLPLPDVGKYKFVVFMTDYDHYLAIFTCKKLPLIHEWSAAILSRTPVINMDYVDKIRTRLSSYNIDPFSLSIIEQKDCPKPGEKGIAIKAAAGVIDSVKNTIDGLVDQVQSKVTENPKVKDNDLPIDVRNNENASYLPPQSPYTSTDRR